MTYEYNRVVLPPDDNSDPSYTLNIDRTKVWGVFFGLFGMPNNERIIVSHGSIQDAIPDHALVQNFLMTATARPQTFQALTQEGLYVNRTFNVLDAHVDEFVELSQLAWETFENDSEFAAHPFGLFRPELEIEGLVPLQLFTWYDSLFSWERSRNPDEAASENFARRRMLTVTSSAIATRLVRL